MVPEIEPSHPGVMIGSWSVNSGSRGSSCPYHRAVTQGPADPGTTQSGWQGLVLLSCLMLFLELALIRLVSAHNVYVRYFTNFVLLASFLGIGLGFLRAHSKRDSFSSLPFFLLLTIAFVLVFPVGQRSGSTHGAFGWPSLPVWLSLPLIFTLVTLVMMSSAAGVARAFATFRPLHAYRLDKEHPVADDWTAERAAVLIAFQTVIFARRRRPIPLKTGSSR